MIVKVIGVILSLIIIAAFIMLFTFSDKAHVERSITIEAAPEEVYALLIDMKQFNQWSPWFDKDPDTQYDFDGSSSGIGAKMLWTSEHPEVGNGTMWIVAAEDNKMIESKMKFDGYPGEPSAFFYIEPSDGGSKVTWTYDEELAGIGKIMAGFLDLDEMLGPDYEKGLWKLKIAVESQKEQREKENQESEQIETDIVAI